MYLLILNVLFMFLDTTISKELFDETVVDISSYIIEILPNIAVKLPALAVKI